MGDAEEPEELMPVDRESVETNDEIGDMGDAARDTSPDEWG